MKEDWEEAEELGQRGDKIWSAASTCECHH